MKIIVLNRADYREKDTIIDAISEEGPVSFKVRGSQDPKSAFAWLNNPLTVAEVEYSDNPKYVHKVIKGAILLDTPMVNGDYSEMLSINFVAEIINRMLQKEERHLLFNDVLAYIAATKNNPNGLLPKLIFLAKAIRCAGSGLVTDCCAICGSKSDIVSFSFIEGGLICRKCLTPDTLISLNSYQMKLLRAVNERDITSDLPEDNIPLDDKRILLSKLVEYVKDGIGVYLDTPRFILDNISK